MKIKRKVEMTHEEYAKYMIDKFGIASYERELIDNNIFDAPMEFEQTFTLNPMRKDDDPVIERSFKGVVIEVEEVVDEDTKLPKSLAIFKHNGNLYSEMHDNKNINDILKMDIKVKSSSTKTIHMVNDDGTHTLIWRDGKLVE